MNQLHLRLKNCIQTILDLEAGIKKNNLDIFDADFLSLRQYMENMEQIQLKEEEVIRLENATSHFLREIGRKSNWVNNYNLLQ